jgi:hypothetical protein
MESSNLLLRDIHLPEPVGWWPPAIGWWIVLMLIVVLVFLLYWLYKRITRRTAIKTAMKLLQDIKQDTSLGEEQKLAAISALIRRVAISIFPREDVAGLTGKRWLEFLDETLGEPRFSEKGKVLTEARYWKDKSKVDAAVLIALCEDWLKGLKKRK